MWDDVQAAVAVCCKRKARLDILCGEVREILQHLWNGHSAAQIIEHVDHCDASTADARLATANTRVNGDALAVIHSKKIGFRVFLVKGRTGSQPAGLKSVAAFRETAAACLLTPHEIADIRDTPINIPVRLKPRPLLLFHRLLKMPNLGLWQEQLGGKRSPARLTEPMNTAVQRRLAVWTFETHRV